MTKIVTIRTPQKFILFYFNSSDGYTCITSPVMSTRSIPIHETEKETSQSRQIIRCSGTDSGLSSEEGSDAVRPHLSSSSSSSNDEMKNDCNSSDKSSYSEKQEKESAKETAADRLQGIKITGKMKCPFSILQTQTLAIT